MESITLIVAALATGAAAATDVATDIVKNAYAGLKPLIARKFADKPDVVNAVRGHG